MLREIRIRDLGVIGESTVTLHPGLTVVTGETGAGKTMVVTGLGLLLGDRATPGLVRDGAERAAVEGLVDLPADHPAMERARAAGADTTDGLILVRTVSGEGRSRAFAGGCSVPVGLLGELGELLVAVHGQADQWRLRRLDAHRELLDAFGGPALAADLAAYRDLHETYRRIRDELAILTGEARARAQRAAALRAGLELLERVDPRPGEDDELAALSDRLGHLEELRSAAGRARITLAGDDEAHAAGAVGVLGMLANARNCLEQVRRNDAVLAQLTDRLAELTILAGDLAADVGDYLDELDVEPGRLEAVHERRAALSEVTRLYGPDVDAALAWGEDAARELTGLLGDDERIGELTSALAEVETAREAAAETLTASREAAAARLSARITEELARLAMPGTKLHAQLRRLPEFGAHGVDEVELVIASGKSARRRSITRAASGGELSRIMLAIEVAVADVAGEQPTFVFDEVDAGVGGRAALAVGARLAALAKHAQVVVVTHLPQVAAYADRHLVVTRPEGGPVEESDVTVVEGENRIRELARMLSGTVSAAALEHARDLLARVPDGRE